MEGSSGEVWECLESNMKFGRKSGLSDEEKGREKEKRYDGWPTWQDNMEG